MFLVSYEPIGEIVARFSRNPHGRASNGALKETFQKTGSRCSAHCWSEDRIRPRVFFSNQQPCFDSENFRAIRNIEKSCEIPEFGDRFYSIQDLQQAPTFTRSSSSSGTEEHLVWNQHGETRCVITVTKHKSLVLISEYKLNQIKWRRTKNTKSVH